MARQSLVDECVFGIDEIEDAEILAHQILKEGFRLLEHRLAQIIIEIREAVAVRLNRFETPDQDLHVLREHRPAVRLGKLLKEDLDLACDVIAMESVHLSEFDFIDLGQMIHPSEVVPVTIKSLLFAGGLDRRSVKKALQDAALQR